MKGKTFEERVARFRKAKHKGGAGEPDYTRGPIKGEVKDWKARVGKTDLLLETNKGRNEIVSQRFYIFFRPKKRLISTSSINSAGASTQKNFCR